VRDRNDRPLAEKMFQDILESGNKALNLIGEMGDRIK
jgi:hypothetical protein